ncbi:MAG: AraC family transcriptional regulator [Flavitalea sp.]
MIENAINPVQLDVIYNRLEKKPVTFLYEDFLKVFDDTFVETEDDFFLDQNKGRFNAYITPGIHVWEGSISISTPRKLIVTTIRPAVQMIFCTKGSITYHLNDTVNKVDKAHHNVLFLPAGDMMMEWHPSESTNLVIISLSADFFTRLMTSNSGILQQFQKAMTSSDAGWLAKKNMNIYQQSIFILQKFANTRPATSHKRLFVEAKVIELLGHQLDQFEEMQEKGNSYSLKAVEIEKMYMVRSIILNNLSHHYSLIELAHLVGTNECYLKDHFKKVFGTTVYGFTQKAKMEKAKELILIGGKKISEVAKTTGFKYTSHFTSSFKKHFGVLPNKIKLLFLIGLQEFECLSVMFCESGF